MQKNSLLKELESLSNPEPVQDESESETDAANFFKDHVSGDDPIDTPLFSNLKKKQVSFLSSVNKRYLFFVNCPLLLIVL